MELTWMGHRATVSSLAANEYKHRLRAQGLEILFTETLFRYAHRPKHAPGERGHG
ncbi:hypothetical protein [Streptomyces sp. NPDC001536]|uniref:hypothetical protein n=1 Tax=Streptomyces sp. NPDC001536 TaxID=3364583 RepID=UPI00367DB642